MKKILSKDYLILSTLCLLLAALFYGCAGVQRQDTPLKNEALLEPQAAMKFSDIPVPVGFQPLLEDSYAFESSGVRVAILKYRGKAKIDQVVNFYKDQMPLYNWDLLNVIEYGEHLLNFEREQETCIVNLTPKGNNITITISLGPKSGTRAKKVDKPVK